MLRIKIKRLAQLLGCVLLVSAPMGCTASAGAGATGGSTSADVAGATGDSAAAADGCGTKCEPGPSCDDGKLNGSETAIDCGGTCAPCAVGSACKATTDCATTLCRKAICRKPGWILGKGGDLTAADITVVVKSKLSVPSALAFNPAVNGELWVVSRGDGSLAIVQGATGDVPVSVTRYRDETMHFLEKAVAIAFSDNATFGTCGDTRNDYGGKGVANDFMGPVLWPALAEDFVNYGPDAAKVHLDMMHDTPQCMGIAAISGNKYYAFNGKIGAIDMYEFGTPHPHGADVHEDGVKMRFAGLGLKRVASVPSQLFYDSATGMLWIADTGNGQIMRLDTTSGQAATTKLKLYPNEVAMTVRNNAALEYVAGGLDQPSGLVRHEGILYVSEAGSGRILAITPSGDLANVIDTKLGPGVLGGLAVGPDDRLYFVDRKGNRVLRLDIL